MKEQVMVRATLLVSVGAAFASVAWASLAVAQQVNLGTPQNNAGDSFFESVGVSWGFNLNGGPATGRPGSSSSSMFFNFGGTGAGGGAAPAFGGFDPSASARTGFLINGSNGSAFFNLSAGQGNSSSISSQTPSVTIPNGGTGFFFDGTIVPFVIGVVPVVGAYSPMSSYAAAQPQSVLAERLARLQQTDPSLTRVSSAAAPRPASDPPLTLARPSSAQRGDLSVAEIRRQRAAASAQQLQQHHDEIARLVAQARDAEQAGKPAVASIFYRQAAQAAEGKLRQQLLGRSESLRSR
jgi:hypothetical protein